MSKLTDYTYHIKHDSTFITIFNINLLANISGNFQHHSTNINTISDKHVIHTTLTLNYYSIQTHSQSPGVHTLN